MCSDLFYTYLMMNLVVNSLSPPLQLISLLVIMFLGYTPPDKAKIVRQYSDVNTPLLIIFAKSSLGVDCSSIQGIHSITRIIYSRNWESRS